MHDPALQHQQERLVDREPVPACSAAGSPPEGTQTVRPAIASMARSRNFGTARERHSSASDFLHILVWQKSDAVRVSPNIGGCRWEGHPSLPTEKRRLRRRTALMIVSISGLCSPGLEVYDSRP